MANKEKNTEVTLLDMGRIDYAEAWEYQKQLFDRILEAKKKEARTENFLLFCEHPHVYTLGKSGDRSNLLVSDKWLEAHGIAFYQTDRGGDITYHGPGQVVGYPVFDLDNFDLSVKEFVFDIETILIRVIKRYGLHGARIERATGVWIDALIPGKERKIAAIGMRIQNKVSMHGFALNVNTNLEYFSYINPCGFQDKGVTSLQKELQREVETSAVKKAIIEEFETIFEARLKA
ncbi:lipoyl(octanoyl) transferase LipB [Candidatus Sulfidibacterium hydrothermale]|uniref:lipoyl(octanoyl) transferase LipB n=1 Tax=Candidatus Sulfidibacterium hydrothermale TaxID=2875962 RepID=UPI001F0B0746|nr:lipoyl(octanoyl) transferase LipB [Candidatus Sulfidibacterium hydrothermale]UBM62562.1 lipoyl(octanoyl) transferase LipB [Candidatus Sulfidibacterium hydrothermale]